ncbi:MAG: PrgI family protein [Candidatus Staskawiczbacteria bacterium]|nr:PrgI family protein [Candidatus Staskawiczbacteria bacterium]
MERYPIPQFIEQEGKIAFFISFRQFFYLIGAGIVLFILYYTVSFFLFVLLALIIVPAAIILAFATYNGAPILNVLFGGASFFSGGKIYTWRKKESPYPFKTINRPEIKKIDDGPILKAQQSRLRDMHTKVETKTT